jgi:type VI secretion system secreted protein VgrG
MPKETFQIKSDSPVNADLMFWQIAGHESLSRPSLYQLSVLSEKSDIDAKDILGRAFDVVIDFFNAEGEKKERHCQGHGIRFSRLGKLGRYYLYQISLQSWFGLLTKRTNSRILQDKPILEILEAIFEDSPIKRFKKLTVDNVTGTHDPLRYCVQHQENDYQYTSRLLEDEGIYYWFDSHDEAGTMHLSDSSDVAHEKLPVSDTLKFMTLGNTEPRFNQITRWTSARQFDTGKHDSRDSNFKTIRQKIGVSIDVADDYELAEFESFEFPGGYFDNDTAQDTAKIRGHELIARRDRHFGATPWPDVAVGKTFALEGDSEGLYDGDYLIGSCTFFVSHPGYESLPKGAVGASVVDTLTSFINQDAFNVDSAESLINFIADSIGTNPLSRGAKQFFVSTLPGDMPFRPPRLTPKVKMPGPQSAIVVGPKGEELHVDDKGRVKVQFHWDRYGEKNEKSTCWVRVSQPWAGKGWGGYFIPRIGQEVIVDFLNGDPDRPIIVGRVYNDEQTIPYSSPTQSGFKSRSTPGGSAKNYNEIMFEDKKGNESLSMHAEKDMSSTVENDDSTSVGHDQSVTVQNDQTTTVKNNRKLTVTGTDTNNVTGIQKVTIGSDQINHIVANQKTEVHKNHSLTVTGDHSIKVEGHRFDETTKNENRTVTGNQTITVTGDISQKAAKMSFEAGHIDFKVTGPNSVHWDCNVAPFKSAFKNYELVSNKNIDLFAIGEINQTSMKSNTTVLGNNDSGHIGNSSQTNMGRATSTFMGSATDNFFGISQANFAGLQISNTLALSMQSVVGPRIEKYSSKVHDSIIHVFKSGAAAGEPVAPSAIARVAMKNHKLIAILSALRALWTGGVGIKDTRKQYQDGSTAIAKMLVDEDNFKEFPELRENLKRFQELLNNRGAGFGEATVAIVLDTTMALAPAIPAAAGAAGVLPLLAASTPMVAMALAGTNFGDGGVAEGAAAFEKQEAGLQDSATQSSGELAKEKMAKAESDAKAAKAEADKRIDAATKKAEAAQADLVAVKAEGAAAKANAEKAAAEKLEQAAQSVKDKAEKAKQVSEATEKLNQATEAANAAKDKVDQAQAAAKTAQDAAKAADDAVKALDAAKNILPGKP